MKQMLVTVWTALVLSCARPAFGQVGDGYVGIYADAAGTQPCAYVPVNTAKVLYVLAKTANASSNGITGAEFRIEVTNPSGWELWYRPPGGAIPLGDPLDLNPGDPNDGSGLTIAFSSCRQPVGDVINLGTISVFNDSGVTTGLLVKCHSTPTNPNYPCPLFVLCDAPVYTKVCMTPSTDPACSTLAAPKPTVRAGAADTPVARLGLSPELPTPPTPPSQPFTEEFLLSGDAAFWVGGRQVQGPRIVVRFENEQLSFNGEPVILSPSPPPVVTDQTYEQVYKDVPRFRELRAAGMSVAEAGKQFEKELEELIVLAVAICRLEGVDSAVAEIRRSPLVMEVAEVNREHKAAICMLKGCRGGLHVDLGGSEPPQGPPSPPGNMETHARKILSDIEPFASQPVLILITRDGNLTVVGGEKRARAEAQIAHVLAGNPPETAPRGPLNPKGWTLKEIAETLQR